VDVSRAVSESIKIWLAGGGVALIVLWRALPRRVAISVLLTLTLFGAINYAQWGSREIVKKIESYDLLHYYICAKYFDELGYYDLYPALILADSEHPDGRYSDALRRYRAQSEKQGYLGRKSIPEAIERGTQVRETRFSSERWQQFTEDFYHLQRDFNMSPDYWRRMMDDRGFNGTPVWLLIARPIASAIPVTYIKALCYLDVLWLLIALLVIRWAYDDWVPVLWCLLFSSVTYSLRWPMPGQVFLRFDWVAMMLICMGLLKKGKPLLAGMFAGVPGLLRIFPAIWMLGPALKGLFQLAWPPATTDTGLPGGRSRSRIRINRSLLWMAGGFVAAIIVFEGVAWFALGADTIETHATNIRDHIKPKELSSRRIGFAIGYTYDGELTPTHITEEQKQAVVDTKGPRTVVALVLLLGLGIGARRMRNDEVYALGFVPFFLLATFSYYYAIARLTLIVLHAHDMSRWRNRVGLGLLFAIELFSNYAQTVHRGHRVYLVGHLSWGLTAYAVLMISWLVLEQLRALKAEQRLARKPAKKLREAPTA